MTKITNEWILISSSPTLLNRHHHSHTLRIHTYADRVFQLLVLIVLRLTNMSDVLNSITVVCFTIFLPSFLSRRPHLYGASPMRTPHPHNRAGQCQCPAVRTLAHYVLIVWPHLSDMISLLWGEKVVKHLDKPESKISCFQLQTGLKEKITQILLRRGELGE